MSNKAALIILDGFGKGLKGNGNAIHLARTPFIDYLYETYPHMEIKASGEAVGLEAGQMGDSNVGHLNLGAGRIVWQMLPRIKKAILDGELKKNKALNEAIKRSKETQRPLHLMGLVSDGGVHSHMDTILDLLNEIAPHNIKVNIHAFLDGRDVIPKSAHQYLSKLEKWCEKYPFASIATISGRYYAMDRDNRLERTELAFDALVNGKGLEFSSSIEAVHAAYEADITDEFVKPSVIYLDKEPVGKIESGDNVIFFNFRADRARQITKRLIKEEVRVIGMTQYEEDLIIPIIFPQYELKNTLSEWLSSKDKTQLHIAETEKYAHVTFFFNGGQEKSFKGEDRILINSPKVATYDMQPEMSANKVTESAMRATTDKQYDFMILNYANCDMVGHTGNIEAAIKAVETVDSNLSRLIPHLIKQDYQIIVTADHGNAEKMLLDGKPYTAHTSNLVPLIVISKESFALDDIVGKLGDVAPTVLCLMGIEKPEEMTGNSLLKRGIKNDSDL